MAARVQVALALILTAVGFYQRDWIAVALFECAGLVVIYALATWHPIAERLFVAIGPKHPMASVLVAASVGAFLFGGGFWLLMKQYNKAPSAPTSVPALIKTSAPAQFVKEKHGGMFIVIPDLQITNRSDSPIVLEIALLVERQQGIRVHRDAEAERAPEIEHWLTQHRYSAKDFLGRQINLDPRRGTRGYMAFFFRHTDLSVLMIDIDRIARMPLFFEVHDTVNNTKRTLSVLETIFGR